MLLATFACLQPTLAQKCKITQMNAISVKLNGNAEKVSVPQNYSLSFDVYPTGIIPQYGNLLHYTKDNTNAGPGGRVPGNFSHSSMSLQV